MIENEEGTDDGVVVDDEATAIGLIAMALGPLSDGARERVLAWARSRFVTEPTYLGGVRLLSEATAKLTAAADTARAAGVPASTISGAVSPIGASS